MYLDPCIGKVLGPPRSKSKGIRVRVKRMSKSKGKSYSCSHLWFRLCFLFLYSSRC